MTLEDRIKSLDNRERALLMDCITMLHSCELIEDFNARLKDECDKSRLTPLYEVVSSVMGKIDKMYPSVEFPSIDWQPFDPENPPTDTKAEYLIEGSTGGFIHCHNTGKCFYIDGMIINFKLVKAYAIINASNF